jgi:high-affinity K+ transport system ATPase subunit B
VAREYKLKRDSIYMVKDQDDEIRVSIPLGLWMETQDFIKQVGKTLEDEIDFLKKRVAAMGGTPVQVEKQSRNSVPQVINLEDLDEYMRKRKERGI